MDFCLFSHFGLYTGNTGIITTIQFLNRSVTKHDSVIDSGGDPTMFAVLYHVTLQVESREKHNGRCSVRVTKTDRQGLFTIVTD